MAAADWSEIKAGHLRVKTKIRHIMERLVVSTCIISVE